MSDLNGVGLSATGISIEMDVPNSHSTALTVNVAHANFGKPLGHFANIRIHCPDPIVKPPLFSCPRADVSADSERFGRQSFDGRVAWNSATHSLSVDASGLHLAAGTAALAARWSRSGWSADVGAQNVVLESLRTLLGDALPLGPEWTLSGTLERLHAVVAGGVAVDRLDVSAAVSAVNFGNADGSTAGQQLSTSVELKVRRDPDGWRVDATATAPRGEFLDGRVYWNFQNEPASLQASAAVQNSGMAAIGISQLTLGKLLHARGSAVIQRVPHFSLNALGLDVDDLDIAALPAATRDGLFAGTVIAQIEGLGHARGRIEIENAMPASIDMNLSEIQLHDSIARLGVEHLDGHLMWRSAARQQAPSTGAPDAVSQLRWSAASLYGVAAGGAGVRFTTSGSDFILLDDVKIPILDGGLAIKALELRRFGTPQMSLHFDADIDPISLPPLCRAFGWPEFAGRLSGHIPNLSLQNGELTLGGNLDASVFEGRVLVSGLKLKDAFGARPRLQATVALERLDLAEITGAFSVGKITGRIDGKIDALELVGWEPTAFDARFYSTPNDRTKKRISQRAVENISSIGGGSAAAILQRGALRFFDDFNYAELGISCKLVNDVCIMGGIEAHHPGYTLVKGSGLPRIQVFGSADHVDWLQLVASLKELPNSHPSIGSKP
jgi:hypothetical protein